MRLDVPKTKRVAGEQVTPEVNSPHGYRYHLGSGLIFLVSLFVLTGCYTGRQPRGRLSDVMAKSADSTGADRQLVIRDSIGSPSAKPLVKGGRTDIVWSEQYDSEPETDGTRQEIYYGLTLASGSVRSDELYGLNTVSFSAEQYITGSLRGDITATAGYAPLQTTGKLDRAIRDGVLLGSVGLDINLFTTFRHTFMGHYLFGGADYTYMAWSYRNPVEVVTLAPDGSVANRETVGNDALDGVDIHIGMGVNLIQTDHLIIGSELQAGVIVWGLTTRQGFVNDIFNPWGYVRLGVGVKGKW